MDERAVERRSRFGPHLQEQLDRFLHLPNAGRVSRREFPPVLPIFLLEKARADTERQSSSNSQGERSQILGPQKPAECTAAIGHVAGTNPPCSFRS